MKSPSAPRSSEAAIRLRRNTTAKSVATRLRARSNLQDGTATPLRAIGKPSEKPTRSKHHCFQFHSPKCSLHSRSTFFVRANPTSGIRTTEHTEDTEKNLSAFSVCSVVLSAAQFSNGLSL